MDLKAKQKVNMIKIHLIYFHNYFEHYH